MRPIEIAQAALCSTCPECKETTLKTIESRLVDSDRVRRRRRACSHCGHRDTTYEVDEKFYREAREYGRVLGKIQMCLTNKKLGDLEESVKKPERTCEQCFHMSHYGCSFDFPEAGGSFAEECSMFAE
jgi:hypothetical protein